MGCILYLGPGKGWQTLCPDLCTQKGSDYLPNKRKCEDQDMYGRLGKKVLSSAGIERRIRVCAARIITTTSSGLS